jgi:hypothetical protein
MTKEERNQAMMQGFLCRQGDCLRNAFLITMGWQFSGYMPQRSRGYSLGMLAARAGQVYMEFEYIYAVQHADGEGAAKVFSDYNSATLSECPTGANVVFCTGLNEAGEPHGWALVEDKNTAGTYLVDAAKAGVELVQGERLQQVFGRVLQMAIVAHGGTYTANSGAKFVKNLGKLPVLISQ